MGLRGWVGTEPIEVQQRTPPQISNTQLRYVKALPYGVLTTLGPNVSTAWYVESVQITMNTSANVGDRYVYLYFIDRDGNQARYQAFVAKAGNVYNFLAQKGMPMSSIGLAAIPYTELTYQGPWFVDRVDPPAKIGVIITNFDGGDTAAVSAIVREITLEV